MAEPFIGQLLTLPFDWAPQGWSSCNGQVISLSQSEALFSLLGILYGGNGQSTFGLPDLRGRTVVGAGTAFGTTWATGATGGTPLAALTSANLPSHTHTAQFTPAGSSPTKVSVTATVTGSLNTAVALSADYNAVNANANATSPGAGVALGIAQPGSVKLYTSSAGTAVPIGTVTAQGNVTGSLSVAASGSYPTSGGGSVAVGNTGAGAPFGIMPPFVGMNVVIAMNGEYPQRP